MKKSVTAALVGGVAVSSLVLALSLAPPEQPGRLDGVALSAPDSPTTAPASTPRATADPGSASPPTTSAGPVRASETAAPAAVSGEGSPAAGASTSPRAAADRPSAGGPSTTRAAASVASSPARAAVPATSVPASTPAPPGHGVCEWDDGAWECDDDGADDAPGGDDADEAGETDDD